MSRNSFFSTRAGVLEGEVLILKLFSVDGLSSRAIEVRKIASLAHEVGNDAMKNGPLEAKALFSGTQGPEVLSSFWHDIFAKLQSRNTLGYESSIMRRQTDVLPP